MILLAETTEAVTETTSSGVFPPYFGSMLLALVVIFILAAILQMLGYRIIDWITPGNLSNELLGQRPDGKPNVALAIVVGAMFIGLAIVLHGTVTGVLSH